MNFRPALFIIVVLAAFASPARAQLLNFTFTENVPGGTITGEIEGLSNNATSTPTDIIITSQPTGSPAYPDTPTLDLVASGYGFLAGNNTFTVNSTGTITGAMLGIYKQITTGPDNGDYQGYVFNVTEGFTTPGLSTANGVYLTTGTGSIITDNANNLAFAGVTYSAVPEPRWTMAIFLLAGIGLLGARKLHLRLSKNRIPLGIRFSARLWKGIFSSYFCSAGDGGWFRASR